jgi:hypothetical protein
METRMMDWSTESELINELDWLSRGADTILQPEGTSRPITTDEVSGACHAFDALLNQEHDEPNPDEEDDEPTFEVTLPVEMWRLIDLLCVGVDFGDGVGVVGTRVEAVR